MLDQDYYLHLMGIDLWQVRSNTAESFSCPWMVVMSPALLSQETRLWSDMMHALRIDEKNMQISMQLKDHASLVEQWTKKKPHMLMLLGSEATTLFLKTQKSYSELRLTVHGEHKMPVIVSLHPTDLLHDPIKKKQAYEDWLFAQHVMITSR